MESPYPVMFFVVMLARDKITYHNHAASFGHHNDENNPALVLQSTVHLQINYFYSLSHRLFLFLFLVVISDIFRGQKIVKFLQCVQFQYYSIYSA